MLLRLIEKPWGDGSLSKTLASWGVGLVLDSSGGWGLGSKPR